LVAAVTLLTGLLADAQASADSDVCTCLCERRGGSCATDPGALLFSGLYTNTYKQTLCADQSRMRDSSRRPIPADGDRNAGLSAFLQLLEFRIIGSAGSLVVQRKSTRRWSLCSHCQSNRFVRLSVPADQSRMRAMRDPSRPTEIETRSFQTQIKSFADRRVTVV
jgi:hypothetical protein